MTDITQFADGELGSSWSGKLNELVDRANDGGKFYGHIIPSDPAPATLKEGATVTPNEDGIYPNYNNLQKLNELCDFVYESGSWVKKRILNLFDDSIFEFERVSSNYFDLSAVTPDFFIVNSSGSLQANAAWNVSEFIRVDANTDYWIYKYGNSLQYDIDKNSIPATFESLDETSTSSRKITTDSNAYYIRISLTDASLLLATINKSDVRLTYEPFDETLKVSALKDSTPLKFNPLIENDFVYTEGKNLFDKSRVFDGYLNSSGSLITTVSGWLTSDYIEVNSNTDYFTNIIAVWLEYDENKTLIAETYNSTLPTQGAQTHTTNAITKYLRVSFFDSRLDILQVELGTAQTIYETYIGKTIFTLENGDKVSFDENFRKIEKKWFGKKLLTIGTSITFRDQYQPTLSSILRTSGYTNKGVSGRVLRDMNLDTDNLTPFTGTFLQGFDIITIEALANDFGTDRALGILGDVTATGTFYGDMYKIIEFYSTNAPSVKLVFISNLKQKGYGFDWNDANNAGVTQAQYNEAMKESCAKYGIPFIDLLSIGGANEFNADSFYDGVDFIHPGASTGMISIAKTIANNLEIY